MRIEDEDLGMPLRVNLLRHTARFTALKITDYGGWIEPS